MSAIFKQTGDSVDYVPQTDIAAGTVIVLGELIGIAKLDIPAGRRGALAVTGIFDIPKATGSGVAITAGTKLYWDDTVKVATEDAASGVNKYIGKSAASASDDDVTVKVRLSQ